MKLKTFQADSMPLALARVKKEFGPDAVILHTRSFKRGGLLGFGAKNIVEITARKSQIENKTNKHCHAAHSNQQRLQNVYKPKISTDSPVTPKPFDEQKFNTELKRELAGVRQLVESLVSEQRKLHAPQMPEQLFDVYLNLVQKEVADEIARELIENTHSKLTGNQIKSAHVIRQRLIDVMDQMIGSAGPVCPNLNGQPRVVALIGPTGVGKTTTIAKLAADFKLHQKKNVGLITIDTYRIGAVDQLRMYARIIDIPLKVVLTPNELAEAVQMMQHLDYILIDTAGRSQTDELKMKELKTFLDAAKPDEIHLVLSSTGHHSHMISAAENFKTLGVNKLILTKLDEAVSFGVLLSVIRKIDASVSYFTTGQDVPEDIEVGNGRKLAQLLLGMQNNEMNKTQITSESYIA